MKPIFFLALVGFGLVFAQVSSDVTGQPSETSLSSTAPAISSMDTVSTVSSMDSISSSSASLSSLSVDSSSSGSAFPSPPPEFMEHCGADMNKFCANETNPTDSKQCMDSHYTELSDECLQFLRTHHPHPSHHGPPRNDDREEQEARACDEDVARICPQAQTFSATVTCVKQKFGSFSNDCTHFLKATMKSGPRGGGDDDDDDDDDDDSKRKRLEQNMMDACKDDIDRFCPNKSNGKPREILKKCLKRHKEELSDNCRYAAKSYKEAMGDSHHKHVLVHVAIIAAIATCVCLACRRRCKRRCHENRYAHLPTHISPDENSRPIVTPANEMTYAGMSLTQTHTAAIPVAVPYNPN